MYTRPPSTDVLELFLFVVEEGSFSAAAKRVGRTQPAVSYAIKGLEDDLGVTLFDRGGRRPSLTGHGRVLLEDARRAVRAVGVLEGRARRLAEGVESRVRVALDQLYDYERVRVALRSFTRAWPDVALELRSESLGAVVELVQTDACDFGIASTLAAVGSGLVRVPLSQVEMVAVCAPEHPLATQPGPLGPDQLARAVQLVITDRTRVTQGRSAGILGTRTWRFADLHSKHLCLLDGFGWGNMPTHRVAGDLEAGRLVALDIRPAAPPADLFLVHRASAAPGPAGRWLLDALDTTGS